MSSARAPLLAPPAARKQDKAHAADYGTVSDKSAAHPPGRHDSPPAQRARDLSSSSCVHAHALLDTLFFTRGTRIFEISQQRARDVDDALELQACDSTSVCFAELDAHYAARGHSVLRALVCTHGRILAACALGTLVGAAITVFAPVVLHQVVLAFSPATGERVDKQRVMAWLALFIASRLLKVVVTTQVSYGVNIVGLRIAASMRSMLFRKVMRKSLCVLADTHGKSSSTCSSSSSSAGAGATGSASASLGGGGAAALSDPEHKSTMKTKDTHKSKSKDNTEDKDKDNTKDKDKDKLETPSSATANVMNLATADVRVLQTAVLQGLNMIALPIQIVVTTYLLYAVLGVAAFAGVSVIVATLLLNYAISRRMSASFAQLMTTQDRRMQVVKETFGAIQVVKFNAWEPRFQDKLERVRAQELETLAAFSYAGAASTFVSWSSPLLVSTVAFAVYALVLGEALTAAKVFTSMALFNALRDPLQLLPDTIQLLVQSTVSIERLDAFLQTPEFASDSVERAEGGTTVTSVTSVTSAASRVSSSASTGTTLAVSVRGGHFSWTTAAAAAVPLPPVTATVAATTPDNAMSRSSQLLSTSTPTTTSLTLRDISFELERRDFAVVYGGVGAGKSSLCAALLGEMHKVSGRVHVRGAVAYYAQQPWIQNLSIRDNILFGAAFDAARYRAVLDACCLRDDLALLPAGDATEIGEKGVNLSGGQKARVSLARACYARADVYILDSPLAAVDTVVQKAIFQRCLCGLLADKTVVLVTHNPEILASPVVTYRLGLANGELIESARVASAVPRGLAAREDSTLTYSRDTVAADARSDTKTSSKNDNTSGKDSAGSSGGGDGGGHRSDSSHRSRKKPSRSGVLVEQERREEGHVAHAVWRQYLHAIGGVRMLALLLASQLLWQAFQILSDVWLSHWTSSADFRADTAAATTTALTPLMPPSADPAAFIETYAELAAAAATMVFVRGVVVTYMGLRASAYLFESMTSGLLHAPLRFFDANPIGRVLNRYGGDMNAVDVVTPMNISACLSTLFTVVCSVVTATVVIRSMSLWLVPVVYLYARVLDGYVTTFRDIRRLMGVAVSPILSHLAQSEQGVETIRAFGAASVSRAIAETERRIDVNNALWYTEIVMIQWFSQRMQVLCVSFLAVIAASFVVLSDSFSPGLVGLVFTYALTVDASLVTLIKTWSKAENSMVSVERVLEYSALEREGSASDGAALVQIEPSAHWPQRGAIVFEHVAFRYKPRDPLVLHDVSFAIRPREKVGVVGRTGAGKSSLTMALFRMNELARGRIVIDGVDIATLPLATLRSRLSIIPQSPVLLEGSLRRFLDPFDDVSDADVLQVLAHVELLETLQAYALAASGGVASESVETGEPQPAIAPLSSSAPLSSASLASSARAPASTETSPPMSTSMSTSASALDASVLALPLSVNGDNLSVGERQMLCMARALLKRSAIVVMDEATAAMDLATERKLSRMIARELADVTLVTIAHRLATVMASDRIMVLQAGRVVEFGTPDELLAPPATSGASGSRGSGGVFYQLVQEAKHSGNTM